ncbi:hypothetical protein ACKI1O_48420, partial [Streptomyces scabiei]
EQLADEADEALRTSDARQVSERLQGLPSDVRNELRQPLSDRAERSRLLEEPRFSVQARKVNAADFFAQLTNESPYSLVVHPDVKGDITVNLRDVT